MSEGKSKNQQKVIGYAIPEELYSRIQDFSNRKNQKISLYMRQFTSQYFTDDDKKLRILIDLPKEKLDDENYIRAFMKQKTDFLIQQLRERNATELKPGT